MKSHIKHADAILWLKKLDPDCVTLVVFDPPYAVGSTVRGMIFS